MGSDEVRQADARERKKRIGRESEAARPARQYSNREIADALFAFLGDYVAWETGRASERGHEAESGGAARTAEDRA